MAQPLCHFEPLTVSPKMKWLNRKKQLSHFQEFAITKYSVSPLFWEKVEPLWETGYYKWLKVAQRLSNATIYPGRPPIRQLPHDKRCQKTISFAPNVVNFLSKLYRGGAEGWGPGSRPRNLRQPHPELPAGCRKIAANCRQPAGCLPAACRQISRSNSESFINFLMMSSTELDRDLGRAR